MLRVGQPFTMARLAELATCVFCPSPPYSGLHAVFQAYHGFHDVVHLVTGGMFAVFSHRGEELGEVVETSGQLVRVSLIQLVFQVIVPRQGLVGVQRVSATHADIIETFFLL